MAVSEKAKEKLDEARVAQGNHADGLGFFLKYFLEIADLL
jgi:hypothetical protein